MMLNLRITYLGFALLSLSTLLVGCGKSNLPQTSKVTGHVSYQGKPVEGANVIFSRGSFNMATGEVALGRTDTEGNFVLTTHINGQSDVKGAVPGEYKVTVSKFVPPAGISASVFQAKVDAANKISEEGGMLTPGQEPPSLVEMFPPTYSAVGKTTLTAKVNANTENHYPFDLK